MSIGSLTFLNPWLLSALVLLPAIWLLLRFSPPRPTKLTFPPTWLLKGLEDREQTPARSPWWLTLMRVVMAALVIAALARPVINADGTAANSDRPLVIVVDNGWGAASQWTTRENALRELVQNAERAERTIHLLPTAGPLEANALEPLTAGTALGRIATLQPRPYRPDRLAALERLKSGLESGVSPQIVWLTDGLDYGQSRVFAEGLIALGAEDQVTVLRDRDATQPLASYGMTVERGELEARVLSTGEASRSGIVDALSARGDRLLSIPFSIDEGTKRIDLPVALPRELRNQVARLAIRGEASAGAVFLLDKRAVRRSVALISGTAREQAQPLLSPLYYVERALKPYADVSVSQESNLAAAVDELLEQKPSMLVLADIGKLIGGAKQRIEAFVNDGGTLLRFAGPRLEAGTDGLLPVQLRQGERTLGGSLSWSEPQSIGPFESGSPFIGLATPKDIAINRQVLADPTLSTDAEIWARLADGTPLVTAARRGEGRIILFHVTANPDWSNLPLSGLFVEMLQRLSELSITTVAPGSGSATGSPASETKLLPPLSVLDGFGRLVAPGPGADPLVRADLADTEPGPNQPPGYYGPTGAAFALNIMTESATLTPQGSLPTGLVTAPYDTGEAMELRPWLLLGALMIFVIDMLAVIAMSSGLMLRRAAAPALFAAALIAISPAAGLAQPSEDASDERPVTDYAAALETKLAFVLSGDEEVDRISRAGLRGLSLVLRARTAIEPGTAVGVDIDRDELAFYPLLYWPIVPEAEDLTDEALAKIDAYMKQGGMIIFDTRDYQQSITTGAGREGPGLLALRRILGSLDLPQLEPVRDGHVLTKSFYLLRSFPGRWDGGDLWAEAQPNTEDEQARRARSADGVSSVLITGNDLAAAWALDISNRPLFAAVPGGEVQRELAFRTGINIVMYALTGNYKADQVHVPALLERLGQ